MAAAAARQPADSGEDNGKGFPGDAEMAFCFNTVLLLRAATRFSETAPSVAVTSLRLENHVWNGVFAQMCLRIIRMLESFNKHRFHGEHVTLTL